MPAAMTKADGSHRVGVELEEQRNNIIVSIHGRVVQRRVIAHAFDVHLGGQARELHGHDGSGTRTSVGAGTWFGAGT